MKKVYTQQFIAFGAVITVLAIMEVLPFWLWPTGMILYILGLKLN